jgi:signal transduction histidine kinase
MNKKLAICILLIISNIIGVGNLYAQYIDHRNHKVDSLEQVLAANPPKGTDLLRVYRDLCWGYSISNNKKALDYARKGIPLATELKAYNVLSDFYARVALCYYYANQNDSVMFYFDKALETNGLLKGDKRYDESKIDNNYSSIYGNIGNYHNALGKYHEAVGYYQKALKIFEKHGWKEEQALAHYNISEMYLSMENYEQAEDHIVKLEAIACELNDSMFIACAQSRMSRVYLYHHKDYGKALENAEAAYRYFFAHPEEGSDRAMGANTLAEIYIKGYGNDTQAEYYARQALQIADTTNVPFQKMVALRLLSTIHLHRGEWRKAEQTALEALATDDTKPGNTLSLYKNLAKAYAHLGNAVKADEYIDKMQELQASWSNKHYQSAIREMETKYETEKKETRIAALEDEKRLMVWLGIAGSVVLLLALAAFFFLWRWTVQKKRLAESQRELAQQQIKQLEREKQLIATQAVLDGEVQERIRLARDLHDGLGSILAAVKYNLIDIRKTLVMNDAEAERFDQSIGLLNDSMSEMRRIAHHLIPESLSSYGLKQSITDFCNTVSIVKFTWYGNDTRLDAKLEVMIYRTLHELVSNALKHSGASHILVQVVQETDRIVFTVQDDGCGFDPEKKSKGMGLSNIRIRVAAYNGSLLIDSKAGTGTEVNIEIPVMN